MKVYRLDCHTTLVPFSIIQYSGCTCKLMTYDAIQQVIDNGCAIQHGMMFLYKINDDYKCFYINEDCTVTDGNFSTYEDLYGTLVCHYEDYKECYFTLVKWATDNIFTLSWVVGEVAKKLQFSLDSSKLGLFVLHMG